MEKLKPKEEQLINLLIAGHGISNIDKTYRDQT